MSKRDCPRTVVVCYLVPVYATVNLDAKPDRQGFYEGGVIDVQELDEAIVRLDHAQDLIPKMGERGVFETDYRGDNGVDPYELGPRLRERALRIAENSDWPAWHS